MIIDAHVHIFPPGMAGQRERLLEQDATFRTLYVSPRAKLATEEDLLAAMDRAGVDAAVLANIGWSSQELCRETNDYLLAAARRHPTRLIPFCSVNPRAGHEAVKEVERCAALGARGIGELHPDTQGFDLQARAVMAPIMQAAGRSHMAVLTHASEPVGHEYPGKGRTTPDILYRFITNFPEARIILAHWGGGLPFYTLMPEVRQALATVWFDTAASPFLYEPAVFDHVAALVRPEKILFATDFPLIHPERLLKQVEASSLPPEARQLILGGNAAHLLGLDRRPS